MTGMELDQKFREIMARTTPETILSDAVELHQLMGGNAMACVEMLATCIKAKAEWREGCEKDKKARRCGSRQKNSAGSRVTRSRIAAAGSRT